MFYCGIDLSARDSHLCVLDEQLSIHLQRKSRNDLLMICSLLDPFKPDLKIVVESTFNWYWLVDGLQAAGFDLCLAHTLGLSMISSAKVKTDRRDAFTLAKLLKADVIPRAYIYPPQIRPVRDLLRRRLNLVHLRAQEFGSLRQLLLRQGLLSSSRNEIKLACDDQIKQWFSHPMVRLSAYQQLDRIELLSEQISDLDDSILEIAQPLPEFRRLLKIPGIGHTLALTILFETGEITRFCSARRFSSYCRLVPGIAQSGSTCRRGRGSKQGNHYLKSAFTQAAVAAVRCYPKIKNCYERHLASHRGSARKLVAYNIIAHKLARAVYYVLRDGVDYKEEMLFGD